LTQRYGLSAPQLIVLRILAEQGPCSVGTLAERVNLSQPTVTGILGRLERRGLISRERSKFDRRRVLASATDAGRTILANAPPPLQERLVERLRELDDWERSQILSSLQRVVHMMEVGTIEASPMLVSGPIGDAASVADGPAPVDAEPAS
jgi:DNA-binding MarR family transcriptional regulator